MNNQPYRSWNLRLYRNDFHVLGTPAQAIRVSDERVTGKFSLSLHPVAINVLVLRIRSANIEEDSV